MAIYHVTTSGGTGAGSIGDPWSFPHARANAGFGDIVHVKAGNYGSGNVSGFASGSTWIGYTTNPEDIIASNGTTFVYGNSVNSGIMPLITSGGSTGIGMTVNGSGVTLKNFQISGHSTGLSVSGSNHVFDNIIAVDQGNQASGGYDGFGIACYNCTGMLMKNSYVENSTAEATKVWGGSGNTLQWHEVRADNVTNPCDYYIILSNTSGNIVEDSRVERAIGLAHGGHGLTCKWNSKNNIFRRCATVYTNLDLNFEDVTGNLYEDITMQGGGTGAGNWHTNIDLRNGANDNTFRNVYMKDVWTAITFTDDNDGFQPNPDTDAVACGYNNRFENLIIENVSVIFQALPAINIGGSHSATCVDNVFDGCTFINYALAGNWYTQNSGNQMVNCAFKNHTGANLIDVAGSPYTTNGDNMIWTSCNFDGASHGIPSGSTTHASGFTGVGTGVEVYELSETSLLRGIGTDTTNPTDYYGIARPVSPDLGIFQFDGAPPVGDTEAPVVSNIVPSAITENTFLLTWDLNEGSKGWVEYGTSSGVYTEETTHENTTIYTTHAQTVGGNNAPFLNSNTTYYCRIYAEDSSGNSGYSSEFTVTTIGSIPVITLIGSPVVNLIVGNDYEDAGATWADAEDGAGAAIVGGDTVLKDIIGTYVITYDYTDTDLNPAVQVTRTVNVVPSTSSNLLFKSGFEGITLGAETSGYRYLSGTDSVTGYSWPPTVWGSSGGAEPNGIHIINNTGNVINELQTVTGHLGNSTTALYTEFTSINLSPRTQSPFQINDIITDPNNYYIKYWMKLDDLSNMTEIGVDWRMIWEYKSDDFDTQSPDDGYRISIFIYLDGNGDPHWHVQGDDQSPIYWQQDNFTVPVPTEEWFKVEIYSKVSTGVDGEFWAKINGQEIANYNGANLGNAGDTMSFMMLWQLYGSDIGHQWIDDIEIWDGLPAGNVLEKVQLGGISGKVLYLGGTKLNFD